MDLKKAIEYLREEAFEARRNADRNEDGEGKEWAEKADALSTALDALEESIYVTEGAEEALGPAGDDIIRDLVAEWKEKNK